MEEITPEDLRAYIAATEQEIQDPEAVKEDA